ncbi:MAG TPA: gliding motility-associated C-terminal domain-containing protein, partial [Flavilitoribacter sp.]|nr:gliding motility-associated C-terminal domain-containing protein [Flavilitoribacter sp.]
QKNNRVFVPTGFTPNNDGTNDRLLVHARAGNPVEVVTFRVFDRWGELVYEDGGFMANDPDRGWDGAFRQQPMNSGVFLWSLEVQYQDGNRESFKGSTTLIR